MLFRSSLTPAAESEELEASEESDAEVLDVSATSVEVEVVGEQ